MMPNILGSFSWLALLLTGRKLNAFYFLLLLAHIQGYSYPNFLALRLLLNLHFLAGMTLMACKLHYLDICISRTFPPNPMLHRSNTAFLESIALLGCYHCMQNCLLSMAVYMALLIRRPCQRRCSPGLYYHCIFPGPLDALKGRNHCNPNQNRKNPCHNLSGFGGIPCSLP